MPEERTVFVALIPPPDHWKTKSRSGWRAQSGQHAPGGRGVAYFPGGAPYRADFAPPPPAKGEKPKPEKKPSRRNDPAQIATARELRDRYLEAVNANPGVLLPRGKYNLARALSSSPPAPRLAA